MSREEEIERKAEEIAESFRTARSFSRHPSDIAYDAAIKMAEWADQHPKKGLVDIEKVMEYLNSYFSKIELSERVSFLNKLRKAMEE